MRLPTFAFLSGAAALAKVQAMSKDASTPKKAQSTVFNGVTVPPLLALDPTTFEEESMKTKYLMVKHYSPYCHHCIDFAPTFQTLYEHYYTSHPEDAPDETFSESYDFRFASINCIAYADLCVENGVQSYPKTSLFEYGKPIDEARGVASMEQLSEMIEAVLEKEKPGSRPKIVELPSPGAKEIPSKHGTEPESEDGSTPASKDASEKEKGSVDGSKPKFDDTRLPAKNSANKNTDKTERASSDKTKDKTDDNASNAGKKSSEKDSSKDSKPAERTFDKNWKAPTPAEVFNNKKPKKPTTTPNRNGISISLTAENFQRLVTMTQDPWFVKFYAPWCPHCQAIEPTWQQLAKNMEGKLNIGEVNCDKEPRLCKDVNARSYPTILFFKGGERAEYRGLRGLGDFVQYADKALDLAGGVPDVDAPEFEALEEKEEVIFVYFYDHATTTEDFMALERLSLSLIGHAKLVKTNDPALYERFKITTWPRLLVSREGRPTYYTPLTPNAMRDVHGVLDWMKSVWLPLVPELNAANARQIMDGKIVVLGVLNHDDQDGFQGALREMKTAANEWMDRQIQEFQLERKKLRDAKQMRIEEAEDRDDQRALRAAKTIRVDMDQSGRKEVGFAWVDGVFWQRWIRTTYGIDVSDGERVIINDQDSGKYYDNTVTGNYIMVSRTAISESLDKIVYGPNVIKPKFTINIIQKLWLDIWVTFSEHPYLSFGCVAGILFGLVSWIRGRSRRSRGSYFKLDDTMGNLKDGLLGQNGNAKAD